MRKANGLLKFAGLIMMFLGVIQTIGAIQLMESGTSFLYNRPILADVNQLGTAVIGIFTVAVLLFFSGLGIILNKKFFWNLSFFAVLLYLAVDIANGQLLFGELFKMEVALTITIVTGLLMLLYLGRKEI